MLTQERLKELLQYDEHTGVFTWIKPTSNRVKAGSLAANCNTHGYLYARLDKKHYGAHRLAWLYMTGKMPKNLIDHIDGNPLNNAFANLREATQEQNLHNLKKSIKNTSGYKGVHFHKSTNKWRAVVTVKNKPKHLGLYATPEEANNVYTNWCVQNRGEFARINP
jgi:hypothetical protein